MTRSTEDNQLRTALTDFVAEALSHLRKTTAVAQLPRITRFEVREIRGRKQIAKVGTTELVAGRQLHEPGAGASNLQ